ncbi:hypothetical protein CMK11_02810 [Candidatus Poribacteria bacterium]|jgi:hypothetical protein|nr:hypothetical protein [Candidatus Poribacteria bacterium]
MPHVRRTGIILIAGLVTAQAFAANFEVAIYTEAHPWPQARADQELTALTDQLQGVISFEAFAAGEVDAVAAWVEEHAGGELHMLILTGLLPTTLYAGEAEGSLAEEFLDAGNTIINTGEYTFYSIEGKQEANETGALQDIIDVPAAFVWQGRGDNWLPDPVVMAPTADGLEYAPSIEEFGTSYPFHTEDYVATPWELEIALAENTEEDPRVDPGVILNTETGGRLGIFVQAYVLDIPSPDISWGAVMGEYILNYYLGVAAVAPGGKLASVWGAMKAAD